MNIFKEKFNNLKLKEALTTVKKLNTKAFERSQKIIDNNINAMFVLMLLATLSAIFKSVVLTFGMLGGVGLLLISSLVLSIYQQKIVDYYCKKYGHDYLKENLIKMIEKKENQQIIVNYFNNEQVNDKEYLIINEKLKLSLSSNQYDDAIIQITYLLNKINYNENQLLELNELKEKNKAYETNIGIAVINNIEEKELEFGNNLKKYL